jgi:predicted membrane protein
MENTGNDAPFNEEFWKQEEKKHKRGKIIGGLFIVIAGALFLAQELGAAIPEWIFSWETVLIAVGVVSAIKHNFRKPFWIIPIAIGSVYLISELHPGLMLKHLLWPVVVIFFGLLVIFKPRRSLGYRHRRRHSRKYRQYYEHRYNAGTTTSSEDMLEITTCLGGVRKTIISKNFRGGEINNVLGGTEVNLSQADFEGVITLEINNVLGGTTLIVPSNWEISSELVSVLGSIEDKRPLQKTTGESTRKLILKGTVFMGGIDIKSYSTY